MSPKTFTEAKAAGLEAVRRGDTYRSAVRLIMALAGVNYTIAMTMLQDGLAEEAQGRP